MITIYLSITNSYVWEIDLSNKILYFLTKIFFFCLSFSFQYNSPIPQLLHLSRLSFQEIEQSMNMLSPNPELPDVSELVTKFFSGSKGSSSKAGGSSKGTRPAVKRR